MNRKAVIYTRVSTDEQRARGFSLQDQETRLRRHCEQNDWQVIAHYQDDHSAKNFKRPEFQRFLQDVESKAIKPDLFLCVRWDRFSRNMEESMYMLSTFKSLGIEFRTIESNYDLNQPENRIPYLLNMVLPQVENERRALNTKRGMRQAKREGRWVGTPPYGYSYQGSKKQRRLVPNEDAAYVVEAFEQFALGIYQMEEVRRALQKKGFRGVQKMQFTNLLRNIVYTGKIPLPAWRDEPAQTVMGLHEPIISESLFDQVQDLLSGRKKIATSRRTRRKELPLRGFLVCQQCGGRLTGSASRSRNGSRHFYYHCQRGCNERFRADYANRRLEELLHGISVPEEVLQLYLAIMQDKFKSSDREREQALSKFSRDIKALEERRDRLVDKFTEDLIDHATYQKTLQRYEVELTRMIGEKADLERQDTNYMRYIRFGFSLLRDLGMYYEKAALAVKQKIIGSIFPEKLVFDGKSYRTSRPNAVLGLMGVNISQLAEQKAKPTSIFESRSCKAPPPGLEPGTH